MQLSTLQINKRKTLTPCATPSRPTYPSTRTSSSSSRTIIVPTGWATKAIRTWSLPTSTGLRRKAFHSRMPSPPPESAPRRGPRSSPGATPTGPPLRRSSGATRRFWKPRSRLPRASAPQAAAPATSASCISVATSCPTADSTSGPASRSLATSTTNPSGSTAKKPPSPGSPMTTSQGSLPKKSANGLPTPAHSASSSA